MPEYRKIMLSVLAAGTALFFAFSPAYAHKPPAFQESLKLQQALVRRLDEQIRGKINLFVADMEYLQSNVYAMEEKTLLSAQDYAFALRLAGYLSSRKVDCGEYVEKMRLAKAEFENEKAKLPRKPKKAQQKRLTYLFNNVKHLAEDSASCISAEEKHLKGFIMDSEILLGQKQLI